MEEKVYTAKELDKILKKCKKRCLKEAKVIASSEMKKLKSLESLIKSFNNLRDEFGDYDSYLASRLLLTEFFDKKRPSDYLDFVFDVAIDYIEPEEVYILKEFILSYYKNYYNLLLRRLEDVSTNK
jgi:hypothetical protein